MERLLLGVAVLATAALLAALALPLAGGQVYTANDLGLFHLPIRSFYSHCLASGDSFLWYPNQFSGTYLHGEGQAGMLHPLNWLLYRFLPLPLAFDVEVLRSHPFVLVGTYLFLRRWRLARSACVVGALLAAFGSFQMVHYIHPNMVGVLAHLPWMLLAVDAAVRERRVRVRALGLAGTVGLTTSQLLLGHPQAVWISLLGAAAYALFASAQASRPAALLPLAFALLLGVAGASVQIVPTWEALAASRRAAPRPGFGAGLALDPLDLVQLVGPYLLAHRVSGVIPWETTFYSGALPLVLVAWLALRWRHIGAARPLAAASLAASALALWLAFGDAGGLYRVVRQLPLLDLFRAPARYVALVQLGLALAAAVAFDDLVRFCLQREAMPARRLAALGVIPLAGLAAAAALVLLGSRLAPAHRLAAAPLAVAGPLLLAATAALVAAAARGRALALAALVLLAALDLGAYGMSSILRQPRWHIDAFAARWPLPPGTPEHRVHGISPELTLRGVSLADGYAALAPRRELDLGGAHWRERDSVRLLAALRVADVVWSFTAPVPDPLPRVRLVTQARVSTAVNRDIAGVDVDRVALVSEPVALPPGTPGEARLVESRPGRITVRTRAASRQLLVLAESHHPGWQARVDGRPCEILRAYGDFMACVVDAGSHEVRFRFAPASLRRAAVVSAGSLALAALWCAALAFGRDAPPPGR